MDAAEIEHRLRDFFAARAEAEGIAAAWLSGNVEEYWDMEPYLRLYRHRGAWEA